MLYSTRGTVEKQDVPSAITDTMSKGIGPFLAQNWALYYDMFMKTNAMRILETKQIPFEVVTYHFDEEALDAIHAARSVGLDPKTVFKTIVMVNEQKQYWVFCLPADRSISLKKARALTESKSLELVKLDQIQAITGYIRGGCSPIGMKRPFPTFIEECGFSLPFIYVSAGKRGMQLRLKAEDLQSSIVATRADFT